MGSVLTSELSAEDSWIFFNDAKFQSICVIIAIDHYYAHSFLMLPPFNDDIGQSNESFKWLLC